MQHLHFNIFYIRFEKPLPNASELIGGGVFAEHVPKIAGCFCCFGTIFQPKKQNRSSLTAWVEQL